MLVDHSVLRESRGDEHEERMTIGAAARALSKLARISKITLFAITVLVVPASALAAPRAAPTLAAPRGDSRGWANPRALELAKEAIEAKKEGNTQLCVEKDQASLALEDHPYVKLHLASCLSASDASSA